MKNVLLILLSGSTLAGALYFTWQKGRESAGNGSNAWLERRMEALDKRLASLDQRLTNSGKLGLPEKDPGSITALRPSSRPPINPPVLTEEQLNAAPPADAELTAAVQKAISANPSVRDALNYYVFSVGWINANPEPAQTLETWRKEGNENEQKFREGIYSKVSLAIGSAIWSAADKDPSTAEMMNGMHREYVRAQRLPYDPEQTGRLENAEKYVDYSTSPPTIDMYALGLEMGANVKLTKVESEMPIPQEAIDDKWDRARAVTLYAVSQMFLKAHAPEMLEAADKHAEQIPVLLARLAKP